MKLYVKLYVPKPPVYKAVQWTGDNLRELIAFTGKAPRFDEWFPSFEAYEEHVKNDGNTFKLFVRGMATQIANVGDYIVLPPPPDPMNVCGKDWFERAFSELVQSQASPCSNEGDPHEQAHQQRRR